ncbi:S49 family peptidase [Zooshikella ganghwensis]|uniref:S49 family peptidase n=1 Tax=Zooshikella ganghwensis TaxID=202772 RepID=UPI0003FB8701|nr:S49 family peptidase [Zooshikella ganghwensis]
MIFDELINKPLLMNPGYARIFFGALAERLKLQSLTLADGEQLLLADLKASAANYQARERKLYQIQDGIAVIPVEGTLTHRYGYLNPYSGMTGYDGIQTKLDTALEDDDVRGILLDINSPGGSANGCMDLADAVYEARQIKPIWALVDEQATSAAYAIASGANHVIAPRTAQTGSIGVIMAHVDQSKAHEKLGIHVTFIHAGAHKADGNAYQPLPDGVKERFQQEIDSLYTLFVDTVARNRQLETSAIRKTEAAIYSSKQAKEMGLIDQILPASQALAVFTHHLNDTRAIMTTTTEPQAKSTQPAVEPVDTDAIKANAIQQERERCLSILQCDAAEGRMTTAIHLVKSGMAAEDAKALLETLPKAEAVTPKKENTTESAFTQHMNNDQHPNIPSEATPKTSEEAKSDVQQMLADFNLIAGDNSHACR